MANPPPSNIEQEKTVISKPVTFSYSQPKCPKMELVQGSGPKLSYETHCLLRSRLRGAGALIWLGLAMFFVYRLVLVPKPILGDWVLYLHGLSLLLMTGYIVILYRICPQVLRTLRIFELLVFVTPAVLFACYQYERFRENALKEHFFNPSVAWVILIFTYSILIPNKWQRATRVILIIMAAPLAILLIARATLPGVNQLVTPENFVEVLLEISLSGLLGVFGVYVIGSLRTEVFEAKQLGQYRLKKKLGAGGMGEVYLAEHHLLKRPCAIKIISPDKSGDPQALARFEREVQASAQLSHWNTVEIFDYGNTDDGTFYYVMEYLPGLSLDELVKKHGPLPPGRAIYLLRQVCDGLREAHGQKLIHRDIKPGNIIAAERGGLFDVAKVVDFGLVKPQQDKEEDPHLTTEGLITGSPLYMSPEQVAGLPVEPASDIYSLGAVAYFLVTGQPPFQRPRVMQILIAHAHETPVPPSQLRPELPADLEQVILRCLAKTPAERYPSVDEVERALADCSSDGQWTRTDAQHWWAELSSPNKVLFAG